MAPELAAAAVEPATRAYFVEYERIVYLDADIQVFENTDELFELEKGHLYAKWSHTPQYKAGYCQQRPDKVPWPTAELGPPPSLYMNAGMFVHETSMATAKALLDTLRVTPPTPFAGEGSSKQGAHRLSSANYMRMLSALWSLEISKDFLNVFFREQYKTIPNVYNFLVAMLWRHPENVQLEKVKAVHYCAGGSKPWRYTGKGANMD
ncbi:hypothetical protein SETIT_9G424900v2 [Setaria italica]|uniref:Hexosyltransferase n=1 Tax=Setaria italica TaxID=4555 RepID=A0A368SRP3_SETIT|nr:hypothetical protein SETIT_9G424900v2 [Setaria italica]